MWFKTVFARPLTIYSKTNTDHISQHKWSRKNPQTMSKYLGNRFWIWRAFIIYIWQHWADWRCPEPIWQTVFSIPVKDTKVLWVADGPIVQILFADCAPSKAIIMWTYSVTKGSGWTSPKKSNSVCISG